MGARFTVPAYGTVPATVVIDHLRRDGYSVIVEDHSTHGSFLNGQRLAGRAELAAGDTLRLGSPGVELLVIRVEDEGGVEGTG